MDLKDIILFLAFILDFALAFFVYQNNRRKELNVVYALMAIWTGLWSLGIAMFRISQEYKTQLLWNQEFILAAAFIASSFLHFSFVFSDQEVKLKNWQRFIIYIPNLLVLLAILIPGVMIENIKIRSWGNESILGWGYIYYGLYFGIIWSWGTIKLIKKYFGASGIFKNQLKYILAGISVSVIFGATFNLIFIMFGNYQYIWLGPYASFIFLLTTTYAILKYRLMDIRIVARKIFIYITIAAFAYVIFYLVAWIYQQYLGGVFSPSGYAAGIIIAPLFVLLFYGLDKVVKSFANRYLFTSLYNYQETINKLADELNWYIDLDKIVDLIVDTIKKTMRLDRAGVLLTDITSTPIRYQIAKVIGFNRQNGISLVQDSFLTKYLQKTQKPLVRDELSLLARDTNKQKDKQSLDQLFDHMKHIEASLCLPLMSSKRLIGIIVLGAKVSGDAYTQEDLELLNTMSKQAGIAIENAILYKQVSDLSAHLRERVDSQVKDIKEKNRQLEKLLAMRSEFLDTASHQLRTPVSVIKGTLEMIATGEMNDLSQQDKDLQIRGAFLKSQKLEQIISDILDASEMDTEPFKINPKYLEDIDLKGLIQRIGKYFELDAKNRGVEFAIKTPTENIPPIKGMERYLEQAIMNLVDNALKYTPKVNEASRAKGSVLLSLEKSGNNLIIRVSDNGIGIPARELSKMFEKFGRASNAKEMYTDGTGLGLFIVKEIISGHQGQITIKSQLAKGTTFTIILPINAKY